ncbi:MAG: hypothetical protein ABI534_07965 [Chloroflexota bacterium]
MLTRLRVWLGWLAYRVDRWLRRVPGPLRGPDQRLWLVIVVLLAVAAVPVVLTLRQPQPREVSASQIAAGEAQLGAWVRLEGEVLALPVVEDVLPAGYWTLQDPGDPRSSIMLRAAGDLTGGRQMLTGIVEQSDLPEAAGLGLVPGRIVALDAAPFPRQIPNPLLWVPPLLVAGVLVAGSRIGYPIFEPGGELNVLARGLVANEAVGARVIGRIGNRWLNLGDRQSASVSVEEPAGGRRVLLTLIGHGGRSMPHVLGEPSVEGVVGYVHSREGSMPAVLVIRPDLEVILLFERTPDRDRLAAMMPR